MNPEVHRRVSKLDLDAFAASLSLNKQQYPHEYALYIRVAHYIQERFLAYIRDPSAAFVRLGGSFGQGLAMFKHADLDLIFFKRPVDFAYISDFQDFMGELSAWIRTETDAAPRLGEWFMERVPGGLREKSITVRVKSRMASSLEDWSVDVDITVALDIHAGLPEESVDPKLHGLPLTSCLSMSDARKLYMGFHASIPHMLGCNNTLEADAPGSRTGYVREQAKSYIDCFVALTQSLPVYVRHSILVLKAWSTQWTSQVESYKLPIAEDEFRIAFKKCHLSSYALTVLVVHFSRKHRNITSCEPLTIEVLKFLAELETLQSTLEICLDDFYDPTCWPQFKARDGRKLHVRDPINPTNDLAFTANTRLLTAFGKEALRSSAFADMLSAGPPQLVKIPKIDLPSDAEELNEVIEDVIVRYMAAQDEIRHSVVKSEMCNDNYLRARRLQLMLRSMHACSRAQALSHKQF